MDDIVYNTFKLALRLLPCPVSKPPGGGVHSEYVVITEVDGRYMGFASNLPRRLRHVVQVQAFSKKDDGTHRVLFFQAIEMLRAAGIKVYAYGPDSFDTELKRYYIAATCIWLEKIII